MMVKNIFQKIIQFYKRFTFDLNFHSSRIPNFQFFFSFSFTKFHISVKLLDEMNARICIILKSNLTLHA